MTTGENSYRFQNWGFVGQVEIDPESNRVLFRNCHYPRRFLAVAQPEYACRIEEIRALHYTRGRRSTYPVLTIVTNAGKAVIRADRGGFNEFYAVLREAVPTNRTGFSTDNPLILYVYIGGCLGGLFAGVLATQHLEDLAMFWGGGLGAVLGVIASHILIWQADRWLKIDLAQLLGGGVRAASVGLLASLLLFPYQGPASLTTLFLMTGTCGIAGMIVGGLSGRGLPPESKNRPAKPRRGKR